MESNITQRDEELVKAIQTGIAASEEVVGEIGERLLDCVNLLRTEQSDKVFMDLSEGIGNLYHLLEFVREVRRGMEHLSSRGYDVSMEPFKCWDNSLDIFREMLSAFENKDWVTLSDLIQYELPLILEDGRKGLSEIQEGLRLI